MTTPATPPYARRLGLLGVAFYALLSPSGKIISSAAAATLLVGGLVTQMRPPSPPAAQAPAATPVVPTRLADSGSSAPVFTYIEVDGQTLPVVLTENSAGNSSVGPGPMSASSSLGLSGGSGQGSALPSLGLSGGRMQASASPSRALTGGRGRAPEADSPPFGPRQGSPSPASGERAPEASQPDGNPMPPPVAGQIPRPLDQQLNCTPATVSTPDSGSPNALPPGARPCPTRLAGSDPAGSAPADKDLSKAGSLPSQGEPVSDSRPAPDKLAGSQPEAPGSQFAPENEAGAPTSPLQGERQNELLDESFPGNVPGPFDAPESEFPTGKNDPTGTDDPLKLIPLPDKADPLLMSPIDDQSRLQAAEVSPAAVPEPSGIALMLLGLAALVWTGRRQLTPARRV